MSISEFQDIPLDSGRAKTEQPNQPVLVVLDYVEKWIPSFIKESKAEQIENEKGLTHRLICVLQSELNDTYPFCFTDGMEDETKSCSPAIDIDVVAKGNIYVRTKVYQKRNRFFAFEAKLLGNTAPYREKEYVIGHDKKTPRGGIERFKKSIHGIGLDNCGMIGYMFNKSFDQWHQLINTWIDDLIKYNTDSSISWSESDKLSLQSTDHQKIRLISNHSRSEDINPIRLYHIWINFT
jgi:hypothetical protein